MEYISSHLGDNCLRGALARTIQTKRLPFCAHINLGDVGARWAASRLPVVAAIASNPVQSPVILTALLLILAPDPGRHDSHIATGACGLTGPSVLVAVAELLVADLRVLDTTSSNNVENKRKFARHEEAAARQHTLQNAHKLSPFSLFPLPFFACPQIDTHTHTLA